jgi:hypothetical protein
MTTQPLGTLEQVVLRSIWSDEAGDFTPWLAQPENLVLLGDTLGLDLEPEEEEAAVGSFSADILCKDTADGSWVVVENQVEKTDHRHLGQILTYAAGLGARTVIWIASKFTDEHRAALDWLNENTKDDISFFGLEIELWRIGNSAPAPKFNIVSKPNDWSKAVKKQADSPVTKTTPHKQLQLEFWTAFREHLVANTKLKPHRAAPQHWLVLPIGRSGCQLSAIVSAWNSVSESYGNPEIRAELGLTSPDAKQQFALLEQRKAEFQKAIDLPLFWHNPPERKQCRIYVRTEIDFTDRRTWPSCFAWLESYLKQFEQLFGPTIKSL